MRCVGCLNCTNRICIVRNARLVGIDNHNDYYDPALKEARLARHNDHPNYTHIRMNLEDREAMAKLFKDHQFEGVVNLAAQAGVRYSINHNIILSIYCRYRCI